MPGPVQSYKLTHTHTHARTHTHIHTRASYSSSRSYKQSSVLLLVPRPDQLIATNCCAYGLSLLYLAPCKCAFIPISNSRSDSPAQLSSITLLNIRAFSLDHHVSHVVQFETDWLWQLDLVRTRDQDAVSEFRKNFDPNPNPNPNPNPLIFNCLTTLENCNPLHS